MVQQGRRPAPVAGPGAGARVSPGLAIEALPPEQVRVPAVGETVEVGGLP